MTEFSKKMSVKDGNEFKYAIKMVSTPLSIEYPDVVLYHFVRRLSQTHSMIGPYPPHMLAFQLGR